jgi:hypothetical protein
MGSARQKEGDADLNLDGESGGKLGTEIRRVVTEKQTPAAFSSHHLSSRHLHHQFVRRVLKKALRQG